MIRVISLLLVLLSARLYAQRQNEFSVQLDFSGSGKNNLTVAQSGNENHLNSIKNQYSSALDFMFLRGNKEQLRFGAMVSARYWQTELSTGKYTRSYSEPWHTFQSQDLNFSHLSIGVGALIAKQYGKFSVKSNLGVYRIINAKYPTLELNNWSQISWGNNVFQLSNTSKSVRPDFAWSDFSIGGQLDYDFTERICGGINVRAFKYYSIGKSRNIFQQNTSYVNTSNGLVTDNSELEVKLKEPLLFVGIQFCFRIF
jgi:hypothetical protein